jgi:hypothetical protein
MTANGPSKPGNPGPTVELREYIERILEEREKAQAATFKAALRENEAKARELERRLEGLNDLRAEVTRDRSRFLEREKCDLKYDALEKRVASNERWGSTMVGIGLVLIVVAGVLSSLVSIWIK